MGDMWIRRSRWDVGAPISPGRSGSWSRHSPILGRVRTGILGGTFDPIHLAHLHAGETALHQLALDRVLFMPAGRPWQKSGLEVTASEDRLEMVRRAVEGVDGFEVDDREVLRDGPTYTVDTLDGFPEDEKLFLILGADAALRIPTWKDSERVLGRATIVVAPRPGTNSIDVAALLSEAVFLDMAVLEVSGTEIREMGRVGSPFRFLVPAPVFDYIEEKDLYAESGETDIVLESKDAEESS